MFATIMTTAHMASKVNWNVVYDTTVVDTARRLAGQKTIAQNAAQCLDELVDLDVIDQYLAEHDQFQEYLDTLN